MNFTAGTKLGAYEIVAPLGVGGMGEVYRARDSKLKREVAIKVLPDAFSRDADRIARFQREAEVLASLNHPHIAAIYDLADVEESRFLVLELVEGETLADRIARGPIPIEEALVIARQIAEAFEAAHEKGIIHRDLKPANVKVTPDGNVKVLDFGLAKMREVDGGNPVMSNSPTMMSSSLPGQIMGTAAYMSPEQAKGREADHKSDVWAFGCVLYEMLTGHAAFEGETVGEILGGIFKGEPEWHRLPLATPEAIRRLLRRCLQKDRKLRLRDIGDASIEITDSQSVATTDLKVTSSVSRRRERIVWASVLGGLVALGVVMFALRPTAPVEMRVEVNAPPGQDPASFAISPNGQTLVYSGEFEGQPQLLVRSLVSNSAKPLAGTDGALFPCWSPDSRSIAFFAENKLKRIDITGGSAQTLHSPSIGRGCSWDSNGNILFSPGPVSPIFRVSETGGPVTPITVKEAQQSTHEFPYVLPGGKNFLFYNYSGGDVYAGSLDGSPVRRLLAADSAAVYSDGHIFFVRDHALLIQEFDADRIELRGDPFTVSGQLSSGINFAPPASVSMTGLIAYRGGGSGSLRQFTWFDRSGKELQKVGETLNVGTSPNLSPDGRYVAFQYPVNGNNDTWLLETARGLLTRLTFDPANDTKPIWSPDSRRIVFHSNRMGQFDLYQMPAGGGPEELLFADQNSKGPTDWSADGRFILYTSSTNGGVWALPLGGDRKPFAVVQTNYGEREAQFAPDAKWIAYVSNESGRYEVYVQPFPGPGGKSRISTNGGAQPRWRRDGKELFYIALDNRLMSVPIRLDPNKQNVEAGQPIPLFRTRIVGGALQGSENQAYMVSSDGQRFLINSLVEEADPWITLILNWSEPGK